MNDDRRPNIDLPHFLGIDYIITHGVKPTGFQFENEQRIRDLFWTYVTSIALITRRKKSLIRQHGEKNLKTPNAKKAPARREGGDVSITGKIEISVSGRLCQICET